MAKRPDVGSSEKLQGTTADRFYIEGLGYTFHDGKICQLNSIWRFDSDSVYMLAA